ncbi:MAG: Gfo/Idh/MocA family oxidoreductase [Terracoccus sp.]
MRIGIIGAGAVAPLHARAAGRLPDVQMTAVCDLQPRVAAAVAGPIGAAVFSDYRDLLASGTTDTVIVNTPHSLHREMAVAAAEAGQHVLVEKPMAISLHDCDAMTDAAERAGVVLRVGHIQHYLPEKTALAQAISRGAIGAVRLVHDYRTTDYRPGSRSPWFLRRDLAGGGAMMNIGAHCLDRAVWLGGSPAATVSAHVLSRFGVSVETDATVTLRLSSGVEASVTVVSDAPRPTDEVTVVGDEGILVANPRIGALLRRDGVTEMLYERSSDDIPEAFRLQLADFAGTVEGGAFAVTLAHSRHVVELVLATYDSAGDDGRPVTVASTAAKGDASVGTTC